MSTELTADRPVPAAPAAPVTAHVSFRQWVAVIGAVFGAFMALINIHVTNASLAEIEGSIGATFDEGSWIVTSYLVAEIIAIPLTAWFVEIFSMRRFLLTCTSIFLFFSVACSFAHTLTEMIVLRAFQGAAGGVLIPIAFQIIITKLPAAKHPIGMSLFTIAATFAPAIGPPIGGWLTDNYSWHWVFYLQLVPGAALIASIAWALDSQPMKLWMLRDGDWFGIAAMAVGLGSLQVVLEEGTRKDWFGSPLIVKLTVVSAVALAACLWIELKRKNPFINIRLLARYNFGIASLVSFVFGIALFGLGFLVAQYLQQVQHYSAEQVGTTILWYGLPQLAIIPAMPWLMKRIDARLLIIVGFVVIAISCFMNDSLTADSARNVLIPSLIVRALGQPLAMVPLLTVATAGIERAQAGSASGLFNMMRNLGGAVGTASLVQMISVRERFHSERIGESVTVFAPALQHRVVEGTRHFLGVHVPRWEALHNGAFGYFRMQSLGVIDQTIRREAFLMAYSEVFIAVAVSLLVCAVLIAVLRKPPSGGAGGGH
jgi:DHA2 family multidrug resistance protein